METKNIEINIALIIKKFFYGFSKKSEVLILSKSHGIEKYRLNYDNNLISQGSIIEFENLNHNKKEIFEYRFIFDIFDIKISKITINKFFLIKIICEIIYLFKFNIEELDFFLEKYIFFSKIILNLNSDNLLIKIFFYFEIFMINFIIENFDNLKNIKKNIEKIHEFLFIKNIDNEIDKKTLKKISFFIKESIYKKILNEIKDQDKELFKKLNIFLKKYRDVFYLNIFN